MEYGIVFECVFRHKSKSKAFKTYNEIKLRWAIEVSYLNAFSNIALAD